MKQIYTDDKEKKLTRIERIKNLVLPQSISKSIRIAFLGLYLFTNLRKQVAEL
jgi:hypothetical protein